MSRPEPKSKRLLIFFYDLGIGGIQRRLVDVIEYLQSESEGKRVKVTLYIKSYSGNRHNQGYIERIEKSGARIIYRPRWTAGPFRVGTLAHMIWTILKIRPDVILTYLRLLSVGIVFIRRMLWWKKIKVVLNEGILTSELLKDEVGKWSRNVWRQLMTWTYARADRIIVPTVAVQKDLIDNFQIPTENISVAKHWTLLNNRTRTQQMGKDTFYNLIYIGRLEPQKNLGVLLTIVEALQKHQSRLKACIVGTGSLENSLRQKASDLRINRSIDFVGRQEDVLPYLSKSQIFILTSRYEGMPVSVLEAKALGIPAVISNFPGSEEVVEDGKDGYIYKTSQEAIERIYTLISDDDLRRKLGNYARMRAEKEFGMSTLARFCSYVVNSEG